MGLHMLFKKKVPLETLIESLNDKYQGVLSVYGLLKRKEPIIEYSEEYVIPEELRGQYLERKAYLEDVSNFENRMNHNEPHLVFDQDFKFDPYLSLKCHKTDYAACQTVRLDGNKEFQLITGNALVWCEKANKVVFQKRKTKDVDWYPGAYSIWGGGFLPDSINDKNSDRNSILRTIQREFMEETGKVSHLKNLESSPILVTKEHISGEYKTGSLQFNSLGALLSESALDMLEPAWEGSVDYCDKSELSAHFENHNWTPFAVASILIWLNLTDKGLFERLYSIYKEKSCDDLLGIAKKTLDILVATKNN